MIADTLWKIRPLINHLSSKFKRLYTPGQQLSLDEGLCAYKGRWLYLSYNPKKPHKWGVKIFQVCDSNNGYCCRFKIAAGGSMPVRDLVLDLMQDYLGQGYVLYVDRYYTSVKLFHDLWRHKTAAVGTCMMNRRGLPHHFLGQSLGPGQTLACRQQELMALKWKDKRDVLVLSTKHTSAMTSVSVRVRGGRRQKEKPTAVHDYNCYMSGVDQSDQLLEYYCFNRKTVKWWRKVFFHLVNLAVVNSQKLYNLSKNPDRESGSDMTLLEFLLQVAEGLVRLNCSVQTTSVASLESRIVPAKHQPLLSGYRERAVVIPHSALYDAKFAERKWLRLGQPY